MSTQENNQDRLQQIAWVLEKSVTASESEETAYKPPYGDVTALNTCRVILDSVGQETLKQIAEDAIDLLDTSVAIYEVNGDYAFGMFSSGWCRFMDQASRALCGTDDNREALACGKWLCHENCWNDSAKAAIQSGHSTDIPCVGGIHLYAEPIYAGGKIVGATNIGYGDPPEDPHELRQLGQMFGADMETLRKVGAAYPSRPKFIVDVAKKRLKTSAKLIGDTVELVQAQKDLEAAQERERHLTRVLKAIRNVNQLITREKDPDRLLAEACRLLVDTRGYHNAWIAVLDEAGEYQASFESGLGTAFTAMQARLAGGRWTTCAKKALEHGSVIVTQDPAAACTDCPLAAHYQGRAALTMRLGHNDHAYGILSVSIPRALATDLEEQGLFEEVSGDIGFALYNMAREEHRRAAEQALRQSREHLSAITNSVSAIIAHMDKDKRYLFANETFRDWYGIDPQSILGRHVRDVVGDKSYEQAKAFIEQTLQGHSASFELQVPSPDGGIRYAKVNTVPHFDDEDKVDSYFVVSQDITEHKKLHMVLEQSNAQKQAMLDGSPDMILAMDAAFKIQWANAAALHMNPDAVGRTCYEAYLRRHAPCDNCPVTQALASGQMESGVQYHDEVKGIEGGSYWEDTAVPILDQAGSMTQLVLIARNVTDRERAAQELRESEERLDLALMGADLGTWDWDIPTGRVNFDQRWAEMKGYELQELEPHLSTWEKLVHPDDLPGAQAVLDAHVSGEISFYEAELRMRHKSGDWIWILDRGRVIEWDTDHYPIRACGTHLNITPRKQAEAERERLQNELLQAQKMESVGRLAGGVAHDFNNKLTVIMGNAQLAMQDMDESNPLHKEFQEILDAGNQSVDIVRQLLAFARKQTIAPKVLQLNDTVEGMLKMLRRLIGEDLDLRWAPGGDLWPVNMDPSQVDQILANLCVNAKDAIETGGKITIETRNVTLDEAYCRDHAGFVPGGYVMLAVSDNGKGMDKETLDNVFEPFFTTKEVGQGTGLGLPTVYGVVKQNSGFINVYSEPGQGTAVKIYLPRHTGDVQEDAEAVQAELPRGRGETVVVVEDESSVLKVAQRTLERLGYRAMTFENPIDALDGIKDYQGDIDLLMTDVIMPDMSGKALAEAIEKLQPNTRTLYMSGYTANAIAHQGVLDKGVHFIQKPFGPEGLARKVRETIESEE